MTVRSTLARLSSALAPPAKESVDLEFLPAADAVLGAPISPIYLRLMAAICALITAVIALACVARIDIYSIASARIQPMGRSKVIQPLERGKVIAIHVANGSLVKQGDVIVELDPTEFVADRSSAEAEWQAARAEITRRTAALMAAGLHEFVTAPEIHFGPETDDRTKAREQSVLIADLSKLRSQISAVRAHSNEITARRKALLATISSQTALVATLQKRVDMYESMVEKKFGSAASLIDAQQVLGTQATVLANQQGELMQTIPAIESLRKEEDLTWASFMAENTQAIAARQVRITELEQSLVKAVARVGYSKLLSPIAGTVQQLSITTVGQVVSPAEQLMIVVPENAQLEAEALVKNSEIGFVAVGQKAILKIDAFPFAQYGTITARISRVSGESIDSRMDGGFGSEESSGSRPSAGVDLVYPVTLALDRSTIEVDGRSINLLPGMTAKVEIRTGERRLIEYLSSHFRAVASEAAHER